MTKYVNIITYRFFKFQENKIHGILCKNSQKMMHITNNLKLLVSQQNICLIINY